MCGFPETGILPEQKFGNHMDASVDALLAKYLGRQVSTASSTAASNSGAMRSVASELSTTSGKIVQNVSAAPGSAGSSIVDGSKGTPLSGPDAAPSLQAVQTSITVTKPPLGTGNRGGHPPVQNIASSAADSSAAAKSTPHKVKSVEVQTEAPYQDDSGHTTRQEVADLRKQITGLHTEVITKFWQSDRRLDDIASLLQRVLDRL